jgi:hypothetical protein
MPAREEEGSAAMEDPLPPSPQSPPLPARANSPVVQAEASAPAQQLVNPSGIDGKSTEDWSDTDLEVSDYSLPDAETEDINTAIRASERTKMEEEARSEALEQNKEQNMSVDEWLDAVKDVADVSGGSVKHEEQAKADQDRKGKQVFIDISSDDDEV